MKTFLLAIVFVMLITEIVTPQGVPPVQGDVVFNTIDPYYGSSNRDEFAILVNRTNKLINLNGYEIQTFDNDGSTARSFYKWNTSYVMAPYSFLLISTFSPVLGISRDIAFNESLGNWEDNGYITLRKQSPTQPSDYIDLVIYATGGQPFTGVPLNSGISINYSNIVDAGDGDAPNLLATRGGISNDINSCIYTGYYISADFTTQLASITPIQNMSSTPLPVELSIFSAIKIGSSIKLNWQTATEVNNYGFEIERKAGSLQSTVGNYEKIGFVNGNGNSNSPKNYSFEDRNVTTGKYLYRLKQIDNDGRFEYSKTIEVDLSVPEKFELSQNYPNPFNPTTTIAFSISVAGNVKLTVFNILGQDIETLVNEFRDAGVYTINFNAEDLNNGVYIYKLETNGYIQTRKMTLIK